MKFLKSPSSPAQSFPTHWCIYNCNCKMNNKHIDWGVATREIFFFNLNNPEKQILAILAKGDIEIRLWQLLGYGSPAVRSLDGNLSFLPLESNSAWRTLLLAAAPLPWPPVPLLPTWMPCFCLTS